MIFVFRFAINCGTPTNAICGLVSTLNVTLRRRYGTFRAPSFTLFIFSHSCFGNKNMVPG